MPGDEPQDARGNPPEHVGDLARSRVDRRRAGRRCGRRSDAPARRWRSRARRWARSILLSPRRSTACRTCSPRSTGMTKPRQRSRTRWPSHVRRSGDHHQLVAIYAINLASVQLARNQSVAAEALLREALPIRAAAPEVVPDPAAHRPRRRPERRGDQDAAGRVARGAAALRGCRGGAARHAPRPGDAAAPGGPRRDGDNRRPRPAVRGVGQTRGCRGLPGAPHLVTARQRRRRFPPPLRPRRANTQGVSSFPRDSDPSDGTRSQHARGALIGAHGRRPTFAHQAQKENE